MTERTEKDWDRELFASKTGLAPTLGWRLTYHTLRSKGSTSGFPDRVLIRERLIFAELKTDAKSSKPTPSQAEWLDALAKVGAEVYLWRPRDLDEIGRILGRRFSWGRQDHRDPVGLYSPSHHHWRPGCLWVGGGTSAEVYG